MCRIRRQKIHARVRRTSKNGTTSDHHTDRCVPRNPSRGRANAISRAVADSTVENRLALTGQIMNIGGPAEFAKSVDEQRTEVASFAAELGIKPLAGN